MNEVKEKFMTVQELCSLAESKKIKLEDLDIEDILKFGQIGFINPTLCRYFGLSLNEVKKIKEQKGVKNSNLENFIRDTIVLYDYIKKNYPDFPEQKYKELVMSLVSTSIKFSGHREFYKREVNKIDWINMDPNKEIELRKIDVENREQHFLSGLYPHIDSLAAIYTKEDNIYDLDNKEEIKIAKKERTPKTVNSISRNSTISENALKNAHYLCELNPNHESFIKRSNHKRYMEPHHLIPLEFQDYFEFSLDVEENIVSLCSHCHNEIHYGENYKELIVTLYNERREKLNKYGLLISLGMLYKMYDKDVK